MESLIFLTLVIVVFLIISIKNSLSQKFDEISKRIDALTVQINKIKYREEAVGGESTRTSPVPKPLKEEVVPPTPAIIIPPVPIAEKKTPDPVEPKPTPQPQPSARPIPVFSSKHGPTFATPAKSAKPSKTFFERNPDLEKFIGENLVNKVGIAILVLGIGFFVKYAIDREWINVYGRVFIGIACGGILVGIAHRLRKSFVAFSSVLVGGGIAVLYLTITIAFHEYAIISQTLAFVIMVLITAFTVLLSITYNRMELAILAILGGFGSPFMVSTGEGNFVVLFTYILTLNSGMLVLAYFKKWNAVNIVSYIFTVILFGSWLTIQYDPLVHSSTVALLFASLFYVLFFAMTVVNNLKERSNFNATEFAMLLSNTFLFYSAGMYILNNPQGDIFRGLFTAVIGVFNFVFAYVLMRTGRVDKNLVFLLIGLVLTFITLAAPIQLEGNHITLFWAAETVLLLWLSQQSGIRLMKLASGVVMGLMWISLAMDWNEVYGTEGIELTVMLNRGYITTLVSLASIGLTVRLLKSEREFPELVPYIKTSLAAVGCVVLYMWNFLELRHQVAYYADASAVPVIIGTYNMLFLLAATLVVKRLRVPEVVHHILAGIGVVAALAYLLRYHVDIKAARDLYLDGSASFLGFGFHYVLVILLVIVSALTIQRFRTLDTFNSATLHGYSWFFVFFFLFLASAELDHGVLLTLSAAADDRYYLVSQNQKIGYPILWGLSSFLLIAIGLRKKRRHLRVISLSVFLITLLKLFIFDIRGISEGGKIAAFISLGVLLLIVSFMYQRLKKFLLSDETRAEEIK